MPAIVAALPPVRQARRQHDGLDQARGIGAVLPGDVEGGAVIDGRADDRQAERDVDGGSEGEQLHRNESLVMVAGHDRVELAAGGADEDGVAGDRAGHVEPLASQRGDDRRDHGVVLGPHQAVLAAVRVEAGDGEARPGAAEGRQRRGGDADGRGQQLRRQRPRHVGDRDVHRRQRHLEPLGVEEHHRAPRAGQVAEQVGVTLPRQAGEGERLLVHRRRGDGIDAPGPRVGDGRDDRVVGGLPGGAGELTRREARPRLRRGWPVEARRAHRGDARIRRGLARDLGADAGGIADRDADDGKRAHDQSSSATQSATALKLTLRSSAWRASSTAA